ncbi:MAG: gamma-glutamyltransferase, partial [Proteobacteria bacterium]|nr:gamma-glutamyltransferase [Pseudomonadota bacterium]
MKKVLLFLLALLPIFDTYAAFLPPTSSPQAAVVSANVLATQAGIAILQAGGNAIDAAVAVGYALAVVHPCCGNLGGGGFMLVHLNSGKNVVLDFRETAPAAINSHLFMDANGHVDRHLAEN